MKRLQPEQLPNTRGPRTVGLRRSTFFVALALGTVVLFPHAGQTAPAREQGGGILRGLKIPPLRFTPPRIKTFRSQSGARFYMLPDTDLPMATVQLFIEPGIDAEKVSAAGTLSAAARLLEIGGAGRRNGRQFATALSRIGAKLSVSAGYEYWHVRLTVLKPEIPAAVKLLEDLLLRPRLAKQELGVIKARMLSGLRRRNDRPATVARRKMLEILYPGYRRGYALQPADVQRISRDAIKQELERRLVARNISVALSGDYAGSRLRQRMESILARLPAQATPPEREVIQRRGPFEESGAKGRIVLVKFPAVQAIVALGGYLPAHNDGDFYALQVLNHVLGGGSFNSRLMKEIRVKRGLAYYAYSYNSFQRSDGRFGAGTATRTARVGQTLRLMMKTIDGMQTGVTPAELSLARSSILNSLVFQFEDPADFLGSEIRFRRHRLPADHLELFARRIRGMGPGEVKRVARRIDSKSLFILVVGPASLAKDLRKIRPVLVIGPDDLPNR